MTSQHLTTPAIHAARSIVAGDVSGAREWLRFCPRTEYGGMVLRACEGRALAGAVKECWRRYGAGPALADVLGF